MHASLAFLPMQLGNEYPSQTAKNLEQLHELSSALAENKLVQHDVVLIGCEINQEHCCLEYKGPEAHGQLLLAE